MRNVPAIVPAHVDHIRHIAANVRLADMDELNALALTPDMTLRVSFRNAMAAWTGTVNDVPICMFGVCLGEMGEGRPWMIGTHDLDRYAVIFLRRCRKQVERMLDICPVLANYVSVENETAIQWLSWLGFDIIHPAFPWGPKRKLFYRFEMRRQSDDQKSDA